MATPSTPVTPAAQKAAIQLTPTGKWRHPQFDEITRRQYATNFDDRNVRQIIWNGGFLVGSFLLKPATLKWSILRALTSPLFGLAKSYSSYTWWFTTAIRLLLLLNIVIALLPLFRRYRKDEIADIPLTPSQRQAMGLDPNVSTPQTPGSAYASPNYVTPPRYQKSTPRSSLSNQGTGESPLSGSQRGLGKSTSNSPFSPSSGSPLFQRAVGGSSRRLSYDRQSPLSNSLFGESSSSNTPSTPTPSAGRASVGLNNKWLYEKGRPSPRSSFYAL